MVKIEPKTVTKGPIDQSEYEIDEFWEKRNVNKRDKKEDYTQKIVDLCKEAEDTIIIHTPKLTLPELTVELEKQNSKGVRTYALTKDIDNHQKVFKKGIMREKRDIFSTYILVDSSSSPQGIWFMGELTSESEKQVIIELNNEQIEELWHHFSHEFWKNTGQELFFGKTRDSLKYEGTEPETEEILGNTARNVSEAVSEIDIDELYLPTEKPVDFQEHMMAKIVVTKIEEKTKDLILDLDPKETSLLGTKDNIIGHLDGTQSGNDISVVFDWDYSIILDESQKEDFKKYLSEPEWEYNTKKKISDIKNEILLKNDNWDETKTKQIQDIGEKKLDDVNSDSIKNWINNEPEPAIPDFGGLYKQISYKWTLHPPYLPKGSKKHRLYKKWDEFDRRLNNKIELTIKEMEKAKEEIDQLKMKKRKKIITKDKIDNEIKELNKIKDENWRYKRDKSDVDRALSKLDNIIKEVKGKIEGVDIIKEENKTNELQAILNLGHNKKKIKVPYKTIPSAGTLYEKGNQSYITIQDTDEIDKVKLSTKNHRAKIVVKGDKK